MNEQQIALIAEAATLHGSLDPAAHNELAARVLRHALTPKQTTVMADELAVTQHDAEVFVFEGRIRAQDFGR